jgi:pSer/pThr/pTyr-binding forkhead associated (FHA) protein
MAFLLGMSGKVKGQRIDIDRDEFTIGRRDTNRLFLDDSSISGHHCSIMREGGKYSIRDHASTNGTRVNGAIVPETRLKAKDIVQIGTVEFLFDGDDVEMPEIPKHVTTEIEVTSAPSTAPETFRSVSPFAARQDGRRLWIAILVLASIGAAVMLVVFFLKLFQ